MMVLILIFQSFLLIKILKYFILSPIYIYTLFSLTVIILSLGYYYYFENKFSIFYMPRIEEDTFLSVIEHYTIALNAFLFGVIIRYEFLRKKNKVLFNKKFTKLLFIKYQLPKYIANVSIVTLFIIVILYFLTFGKGIMYRVDYLPETNKLLTLIIKVITFLEIILLGLIYNKQKKLSITLFVFLTILSLTTGSRSVFLFYVIFILLIFISGKNTFFNKLIFFVNLFLAFVFLAFIMQLRNLENHGLIPYLGSIGTSGADFIRSFFFNVYYSFIYGVYVTIGTLRKAQFDWNIIWVNINPLPGSIAGWYKYADKMRINTYVPFSLHGRVFKMGSTFTFFYFFLTGLLFSYFEILVRKMFVKNKRIVALLIVILLILHIIYAFEYNMRSSFRYFYYVLFVVFILYLSKQIKNNLPKKNI